MGNLGKHLRVCMAGSFGGLLVLWAIVAAPVSAAPISGSFTVDLVLAPVNVDGIICDGTTVPCSKISSTVIKFEADLVVQLTLSGVGISSATVFTFKGLEYQAWTISAAIGALSVRDTFIFAPSIVEVEQVRTVATLAPSYCINIASPGDITPPFLDCPSPDILFYELLEDVGVFHPAVANLRLAETFDAGGMLEPGLIFRKKAVEVSLSVAGMTTALRAMFANVGTSATPSFRVGAILSLEGQTVSGVLVRAETWLGTRQGLECFSECKPIERLYGGMVVDSFSVQEEKLFIRNLVIGGVTFNARSEFNFFAAPNTYCPVQGICYLEINTRGRLSVGLTLENTARLDGSLNPRLDLLQIGFRLGDVSTTVIWYFFMFNTNMWESQLAEFIATFDPPGVTVTSDLVLCTDQLFQVSCAPTNGVFTHHLSVSAVVANFTWDARFSFMGLIGFSELWVDVSWQIGPISLTGSFVISVRAVEALAFGTKLRF